MPQTGELNSIAFVSHEAHDSRCRIKKGDSEMSRRFIGLVAHERNTVGPFRS